MAAAVHLIETVLVTDNRAERVGCMLADMVLSKSLSWDRPLALTALHMTKPLCRDLAGGAKGGVWPPSKRF